MPLDEKKADETKVTTDETKTDDKKVDTSNPVLEKVLHEKKNAMARIKELEAQVKLESDEKLKIKEDWKALAEQREKDAKEWKDKYTSLEAKLDTSAKKSELQKELAKMGADAKSIDSLLKLADLSLLKVDQEHGVVLGAAEVAKKIKEEIPLAFGKQNNSVNNDAPELNNGELTIEAYKKMTPEERKKNRAAIYKANGIEMRE